MKSNTNLSRQTSEIDLAIPNYNNKIKELYRSFYSAIFDDLVSTYDQVKTYESLNFRSAASSIFSIVKPSGDFNALSVKLNTNIVILAWRSGEYIRGSIDLYAFRINNENGFENYASDLNRICNVLLDNDDHVVGQRFNYAQLFDKSSGNIGVCDIGDIEISVLDELSSIFNLNNDPVVSVNENYSLYFPLMSKNLGQKFAASLLANDVKRTFAQYGDLEKVLEALSSSGFNRNNLSHTSEFGADFFVESRGNSTLFYSSFSADISHYDKAILFDRNSKGSISGVRVYKVVSSKSDRLREYPEINYVIDDDLFTSFDHGKHIHKGLLFSYDVKNESVDCRLDGELDSVPYFFHSGMHFLHYAYKSHCEKVDVKMTHEDISSGYVAKVIELLGIIDAIPDDAVLGGMPGVDRDFIDDLISNAKSYSNEDFEFAVSALSEYVAAIPDEYRSDIHQSPIFNG